MYIHTHTHTYVHMHIYIYLYIHIYTHICICMCTYIHTYVHIYINLHTYILYIYACVWIYIRVYVCIYIYIHTHSFSYIYLHHVLSQATRASSRAVQQVVKLLEVKFTKMWSPLWLGLLGPFNTQICPPANFKFQFSLSYPSCDSSKFSACVLCFGDTQISVCLSNLSSSGLPCFLTSITDTRSIIDFSVCSTLYLLLKQSSNFQASYTWNWKLEVSICFIKNIFPKYKHNQTTFLEINIFKLLINSFATNCLLRFEECCIL